MAWCCWNHRVSPHPTPQIPPPSPPSTRKENIFAEIDFAQRDKQTSKTPLKLLNKSYAALARHLTSSCRSDVARVRAIFHWMTSFNYKEIELEKKRPELNRPVDGLLGILDQTNNHACFFKRLAREADIPCVVISGVNKNVSYLVGERHLHRKQEKRAQWNAVLVDKEWRLLDVMWASCALIRRRVAHWSLIDVHGETLEEEDVDEDPGKKDDKTNEFFFLTDPDRFISTHFPDDPDWQLLPRTLSTLQFEKYVYVRERFFAMGLTLLPDSQRYCVLKTSDDGEVTMKFGIPENLGRSAQFRYLIFKELANGSTSNSDSGESKLNWKGCVFYQQSKEQLCYVCNMPTVGRFRMDVFGRHVQRDRDLDLVCSYVIVCDSTANRRLPDDPDIGWGPVTELEEAGLIAESHTDAMIDVTDPVVVIRFSKKTDKEMVFWHSLKHNTFVEEQLHSCIFLQVSNDKVIVVLRLPEPGMYAYKLFADIRAVGGDIPNVCNYLIRFKYNEGDPSSPFPPLRWGLVGPGIQARNLGIVATDREANIGYISPSSPDVNLTLKLPSSDYDIFYETGFLQREGARQAVGVTVDTQGKKAKIRLTLKGFGEYAFNMFVRRPSDDIRIHHVHSVLIDYSEPLDVEGEDSSNDAPEGDGHPDERGVSRTDEQVATQQVFSLTTGFKMMLNFGLGDSTNRGNDDETVEVPLDDEAVPTEQFTCEHKCMETYEEKYSIMLPMSGHDFLFSVERKAAKYPADFIRMERQVGDDVLTTSLPLEGTYVVDVFAVLDDKRLVKVNRYHIHRLVKPESTEVPEIIVEQPQPNLEQIKQDRLFQKRTLRLMEAVRGKNLEKLSRAIEEFRDAQVPDGEELLQASERRLAFLQVSEDLTEGIKNKRLQLLYRGLKRAKKEDLREELHKLFDQANKLFIWLKRIEKINRKVMKLDNRAIAEMRRYKSPPDPIRDVMKGTLLVLGEPEKIVEEWKEISALMGKTGRMSIKRRIKEFDVDTLHIDTARRARCILANYDILTMKEFSKVALPFFCWTNGMMRQAKTRFVQAGGRLDDEEAWEDIDYILDSDDEEEAQGESQV